MDPIKLMTFYDLGLEESTVKSVKDAGFIDPTPIQKKTIPLALIGRDIMGIANTGTGKTASFILPLIDILNLGRSKARMPRALILCPTRELATQVYNQFIKFSKNSNLSSLILIGGESFNDQEKAMEKSCDVIIATPGRLIDFHEKGKLLLNSIKFLVIDEADRMLDMGFIPDVIKITKLIPRIRQTLFFSATMNDDVKKTSKNFLINPKEIIIDSPSNTAITIEQYKIYHKHNNKIDTLNLLINSEKIKSGFIFCNRKTNVDYVASALRKFNFNISALHGDMSQEKRKEMLNLFKSNKTDFLVCSDIASRGIDISSIPVVINYDVPMNVDDYIHRIGRTGRAGHMGKAYSIVGIEDEKIINSIEKFSKIKLSNLNISHSSPNKDKDQDKKILKKDIIAFGNHTPNFF